eukprot:tig00000545_g1980.t1
MSHVEAASKRLLAKLDEAFASLNAYRSSATTIGLVYAALVEVGSLIEQEVAEQLKPKPKPKDPERRLSARTAWTAAAPAGLGVAAAGALQSESKDDICKA